MRIANSRQPLMAALLLSAAVLAGCSSSEKPRPVEDKTVEQLFAEAQALMEARDFKKAAKAFDDVERLHPYAQLAKRAMINSALASFEAGDFEVAIASAKRFIDFFPADKDAPYAQYLIGLSHYQQIVDVGRDQARTQLAMQAMRELVTRYPNSDYVRDARLRMDQINDHLAGKEMEVGRFYLKRGEYLGAINRFRTVVEKFQTTAHVEEALHRLVECYLALGVTKEAQDAAAVLGHNFPGSPWYADSYALLTGHNVSPEASSDGWVSRIWRQVVRGKWL